MSDTVNDDGSIRDHWERVYHDKAPTELSWYQRHSERSLQLIEQTGIARSASIIDVGGGASTLVDDLLARGFSDVAILDLSAEALTRARQRLGAGAERVKWLVADVLTTDLPANSVDLWHDRAVFHFLTDPDHRAEYIAQVRRVVRPGGHVIVATFAEDGPTQCSGLPVQRYSATELHGTFGDDFQLERSERETHETPGGAEQRFVYCWCRYSQ